MTSLVIIIILVVLVAWAVALYNRIITLENRYGNAWSQIDVQLKRRTDLVPNLVEIVKGYAAHEKGIFEELAASRSEEHTSELQSRGHLVCRLLLDNKNE